MIESNNMWTMLPMYKDCDKCDKKYRLEATEHTNRSVTYYYLCMNYKCKIRKEV